MRHEDRPETIAETVYAAQFPVYGFVDHPLDLSLCSHGLGISPLGHLVSVTLTFISPRYSSQPRYAAQSQNVTIISMDTAAEHQDREQMAFALQDLSLGRLSEEEAKQAHSPFLWEGTLPIAHTVFSGTLRYYAYPLHISAFLLKSEKTILMGEMYGPSCDELVQLLECLQVINHQDDLLKQYQYEFAG